jgi:hypothetical protein
MSEVWMMEKVLETKYIYDQNGRHEFVIEVDREGDSFVGPGLSARGEPITGDLRVSTQMEELARIDAIGAVITGVQGMIIDLIHAHSRHLRQL